MKTRSCENFSPAILPLPLIQEEQLLVDGERMYASVLVVDILFVTFAVTVAGACDKLPINKLFYRSNSFIVDLHHRIPLEI